MLDNCTNVQYYGFTSKQSLLNKGKREMSELSEQSYNPNQLTISSLIPESVCQSAQLAACLMESGVSPQSESGSEEDYSYTYPNAATCPDCGGSMIRYGRCVSCPSCGLEGCGG